MCPQLVSTDKSSETTQPPQQQLRSTAVYKTKSRKKEGGAGDELTEWVV
ncbi:MAG: hypothetical protein RLO12_01435 [Fulvivirga sp.]